MIGELLCYLLVTDLRELTDEDIREVLELLVGIPKEPLLEVQERALDQLLADVLDRDEIEGYPEDYSQLLPETMSGYAEAQEQFDEILEELFEDESVEDNPRIERFRCCLELMMDTGDWKARSEAARGIGALEEELFQLRHHYLGTPLRIDQLSASSVVGHLALLEAFETWTDAFREAHHGELDAALETAVEGTCVFHAVEQWAEMAEQTVTAEYPR